ncbi:MAG: WYL domain-containing protein [Cyclobacteriaceae bacterium]|nr:WYL domain-containing protein [Cyclobacteriaceae bacterium]MCH8515866.1 WYL domain-containing protein [Cyclobacteriaceae bacterium]
MKTVVTLKVFSHIIDRLRVSAADFNELEDALTIAGEIDAEDYSLSQRTFQRYIEQIESIFGIEIRYNYHIKKYEITEEDAMQTRLLENFDIFRISEIGAKMKNSLAFEEREAYGTEHIYKLKKAIEADHVCAFDYHKFTDEQAESRLVDPLFLKEFKHRWYLIANDKKDNKIKHFSLDRIVIGSLKEYPEKRMVKTFDPEAHFEHCFGITKPEEGAEVHKVEVFCSHESAKYIESLPWHSSQRKMSEGENGVLFQWKLYITQDLIHEILQHSKDMIVLKPKKLRKTVADALKNTLGQYKKISHKD